MANNSIHVKFNLRNPSSVDATPINLIIRYNNQKIRYSTAETIEPRFWQNDKCKAGYQRAKRSPSFPQHPEFNSRLNNIENGINNVFRRYKNDNNNQVPSPKKFKELLDIEFERTKAQSQDYIDYVKRFIEESKTRINPKNGRLISPLSINKYKAYLMHLEAYAASIGKNIEFADITNNFYDDYSNFAMKTFNLAKNSLGKDTSTLKAILNDATEKGINKNLAFRSKKFVVLTEKSDSIYLTEAELDLLFDLELTAKLEKVRDLFLIGCYTGLRYSDWSSVTKENIVDGLLKVETYKTGRKVSIPLHRTARLILAKYNYKLPRVFSNQKMNDHLKEIGKLVPQLNAAGIKSITRGGKKEVISLPKYKRITTHTARRSFATNNFLLGFQPILLMQITGHETESAFMKYLKLTNDESAKGLGKLWEERDAKLIEEQLESTLVTLEASPA
ncbi:MAG TPA: phage integrase SAM-like domain-containing protein [Puia sp.]|jgi:integrase|nr:phage integrase SAM-like domain-containing protein [Puia sp.]